MKFQYETGCVVKNNGLCFEEQRLCHKNNGCVIKTVWTYYKQQWFLL